MPRWGSRVRIPSSAPDRSAGQGRFTPAVADGEGFVADSTAIGILYLTPTRLQAFEENAGATNTSTVRCESEGLFLVQREDAAAFLAESS